VPTSDFFKWGFFEKTGVFDLLLSAGPVAKAVLLLLAVFSIVAWALIVEKYLVFRRVRRQTQGFLKAFREGRRHSAVAAAAKKFRESPLALIYIAGYQEISGIPEIAEQLLDDIDEVTSDRLEAAERAMRRAMTTEIARLERWLPFLATTASACPFIGLFGTVWGIIAAFHGIGQQGSASLAVVAPGISEALIATAAGLAAAIPAVMGYNFFVNRVKHWATEMESFSLDLLNLFSRPVPKAAARPSKDGV
jgi:biopolymer transport protein TolQ